MIIKPLINDLGDRTQIKPGTAVVLYARCSGSSDQQKSGTLNRQTTRVADWCEKQCGCPVIGRFDESGKSGADLQRPGLLKAVEFARDHNAVIVVENIFRLVRNFDPEQRRLDLLPKTIVRLNNFILASGVRFASFRPSDLGVQRENQTPDFGECILHKLRTTDGINLCPKKSGRRNGSKNVTKADAIAYGKAQRGGSSLPEIANQFGLSANTIKIHLGRITSRVALSLRIDVVAIVRRLGNAISGEWAGIQRLVRETLLPVPTENLQSGNKRILRPMVPLHLE